MLQVERFCPRRVFHPLGLESSLLRLHGDYTTKRLAGKYVVLPISIPFGRALQVLEGFWRSQQRNSTHLYGRSKTKKAAPYWM